MLWYDDGIMYSLYTNGADSEGKKVVEMANLVFAGGGLRSEGEEDAE